MTIDEPTATDRAATEDRRELDRRRCGGSADRPPDAPPAPAVGHGAAASEEHRDDRHRLAGGLGRAPHWGIVVYNSPSARRATDRVDAAVLRQFARLRTDWLTDIASPISPHRHGLGRARDRQPR